MTYLDTRELRVERDNLQAELDAAQEEEGDKFDTADWEEEIQRVQAIDDLESELGGSLSDGMTMIPVDEFEDYARELAEDLGAIDREAAWPAYHIDWEAAAADLATDYTSVEFDGTDYYVR